MRTLKTLLTAALAAFAFAAMPSLAAATPTMDLPPNPHFTVAGAASSLVGGICHR